ncbi:hypothetical protein PPL_08698 [Heterostelium album PN500]|uniref:Uncharacterized protein n=1 Tax=Heterostelium pallidum (strain ATCC 26659 / Pp 5 / PN500) TaxID=670386 RepID=D3BJH2_HETP5|nr:hypothetical protein PPL_08698 [Heterostelium album PN500]EFA78052.1 hypothetical protein PPL_08698 [Heterostelium album PN500]|eukprot:XP_020430179.1 hypothetical protein PPL_08698 [Heterostelium album PN500]
MNQIDDSPPPPTEDELRRIRSSKSNNRVTTTFIDQYLDNRPYKIKNVKQLKFGSNFSRDIIKGYIPEGTEEIKFRDTVGLATADYHQAETRWIQP